MPFFLNDQESLDLWIVLDDLLTDLVIRSMSRNERKSIEAAARKIYARISSSTWLPDQAG